MKITFKKIMGICLSMVLSLSLALPVYAEQPDFRFNDATGHLVIGRNIENKRIEEFFHFPKDEIKSVTIEYGVTKISDNAFKSCTGLTYIKIPDSVTKIGDGAFSGCTGLTSIKIPDSVTKIGSCAFTGCTGLTSVDIGNGIKEIGDMAFYGCTGLTSINIPDSVTTYIGKQAFYGCNARIYRK